MSIRGRSPAELGFKEVLYEKRDWVATITINRPDRYNAYSTSALEELRDAFHDAAYDDAVAVVVLTGAGTAAFCTGGDVKEYQAEYTARPATTGSTCASSRSTSRASSTAASPPSPGSTGWRWARQRIDAGLRPDGHGRARVRGPGGHQRGSVACGGATSGCPRGGGQAGPRDALPQPAHPRPAGPRLGPRQPGRPLGEEGRRNS